MRRGDPGQSGPAGAFFLPGSAPHDQPDRHQPGDRPAATSPRRATPDCRRSAAPARRRPATAGPRSRAAPCPATTRASPTPRWVRRGCRRPRRRAEPARPAPWPSSGSPAPERCSSDVPATGPPDDAVLDCRVHLDTRLRARRAWARSAASARRAGYGSRGRFAGQRDDRGHRALAVGGCRRHVEMALRSRSPSRSSSIRPRASSAPGRCRPIRTAAGRSRCPPTGSAAATPRTG